MTSKPKQNHKDLEHDIVETELKLWFLIDHREELEAKHSVEYGVVYDRLIDRYISLKEQNRKFYKD